MALVHAWTAIVALFTLGAQVPDSDSAQSVTDRALVAAKRPGGAAEALLLYRRALELWREAGDRTREGRTLLTIGRLEAQSGDKLHAKEIFGTAADLFDQLHDQAGEADALYGMAHQEFDLNEFPAAIAHYEKAAELKREGGDRFGEALTVHNLAAALSEIGETSRALDCYRQALEIRRAIGDRPGIGYSLYGIATIYWARADIAGALETYQAALENWRALGDKSGEANTLNSMGLAYQALGDRAAAAGAYRDSLEVWRALKNSAGEAYTLNNMGLADAAGGKLAAALSSYQKALILLRQAHDQRGEAYVLHNLADLEVIRGYRTVATRLYEESLALKKKNGDRYGEAYTLQKIGEGRQAAGDVKAAMALFDEALTLHRAVGDRAGEAASLAATARAEDALGRLAEARGSMLDAIRLIERLRVEVSADQLRASYFATQQDYYEYLIGLLMRMHCASPAKGFDREALEVSERTRSRVLLEMVGVERQGGTRELNGKIHEEAARIRRSAAAGRSSIPSRLDALLDEYDVAETRAGGESARRRAVTSFRPLTAERIQREVLDRNTLLLEFSLGREASYAWLVGSDFVESAKLPARAAIEQVARRYRDALTARAASDDATAEARAARLGRADAALTGAAAALSRMLLRPFESHFGRARLVIVADETLQAVPFGALPLASDEPLLVRHEIARLPSASLAMALRIPQTKTPGLGPRVAILADPVFGCDDPRRVDNHAGLQPCAPAEPFARLRFSRVEAESIASIAGQTAIALDFDAARATLARPEFHHAGILHFATHVVVDDEHPSRSGVVLSLFDREGQPADGVLRLPTIEALDIDASTVVLSACRTALGTPLRGEGLIGLARSFFLAGASRVVASLWDVQDRATADLMHEFYRGLLQRKLSPSAALRGAQLALRSNPQFSHPYYWAGFVVTGDWTP
jgi:CHAT domain-containing protein